ncbi:MAG: 23S rRNA (pseudouridine(1915)-N(3))-methyltransferase RlmH [Campylobacter sp.]|uniref:23S rRNA (pseudouridine(1915)-N(3))-methyltransferase RlmH n=1 Tax=Campylobacter sp. TaxID=205 RepID=UPI002974440B|nr:23S rRNA (pseudouridine(1915)-N(3))-methyltransferase RlmH [Campylobacter sp.]MDD6925005.1 23S rRNA (pseudouridine(1915)-N(3))-methyltransferase RlmH [Campylobacteraceae bacterium]MDD7600733.1 23S rRNA (pseudouridine(1915)-N(3))-methyltransferase RlmH [Campylobacteraceae bacterium]MDY5887874.1 23S rRNA (pseudouridine(1915)-N(3))-methyltransferase RlmH [Campylobacter sp.]
MKQIAVYSCFKGEDYDLSAFIKASLKWAKISDINKFSPNIAKAQSSGDIMLAKKSYESAYERHLDGFCVALDERGKAMDSLGFAKLIEPHNKINFFIGGAYGFSDEFRGKMHALLSLSKLTMAHKIAKLVLFEQIFRALSISANHPYHKGE